MPAAAGAEVVGHGQVAPGVERAWVAVAGHKWVGPDPVAGLDLVVRGPVLVRARVAPPRPVPRDLQHGPRPVRALAQALGGPELARVVVLVQAAAWVAGPELAAAWVAGPELAAAWAAGPELAAEITSRSATATAGTAAGTTVIGALAPGVLGQVGAWGLVPAT